MRVDRVPTPLSAAELLDALRAGYVATFGGEPSLQSLACAWAQCALEHGHGSAIWCNNLGNITQGPSATTDYYELATDEQVRRGEWQRMTLRYTAHASAAEGAAAYWHLLAAHYASALVCFAHGDPAGAASALKAARYYTADESGYAKAMASLYAEAMKLLSVATTQAPIDVGAVQAAGVTSLEAMTWSDIEQEEKNNG